MSEKCPKKVFIICPVRNLEDGMKEKIIQYAYSLNCDVHIPFLDTEQKDATGYNICSANKKKIIEADEVHIAWDGKSEGCLFDMGMAFALNKKIVIIPDFFPSPTKGKSFASMVWDWFKRSE